MSYPQPSPQHKVHQNVVARTSFQPPDHPSTAASVFFFPGPFLFFPYTILIPLLLGSHLHPQHINDLPKMIVNPEILKASSSVAPLPTVIPDPIPTFQKAGEVGNRTLWYAASNSLPSSATNKLTQGCRRHNGSLLTGLLYLGLPCPSGKFRSLLYVKPIAHYV